MFDISIRVPGKISDSNDTAYLDIETRKVPVTVPEEYRTSATENIRNRWSVFAIGIAQDNTITLLATYDESFLLKTAAKLIDQKTIKYAGTRQFDEMVLKGRFTNARRSHAEEPFYKSMPDAENRTWINIYKRMERAHPTITGRTPDIESKNVPKAWAAGAHALVLVHLLRDVCELILAGSEVSRETERWCLRVCRNTHFAASQVRLPLV